MVYKFSSHWGHPSKVPFLRLPKTIKNLLTNDHIEDFDEYLETEEPPFRLWNEVKLREQLEKGFARIEFEYVEIRFNYSKFGDAFGLSNGGFGNRQVEATELMRKMLLDVGVTEEPFVLDNIVVLVTARRDTR